MRTGQDSAVVLVFYAVLRNKTKVGFMSCPASGRMKAITGQDRSGKVRPVLISVLKALLSRNCSILSMSNNYSLFNHEI